MSTVVPQKTIITEIDFYYPKSKSAYPRLRLEIILDADGSSTHIFNFSRPEQYNNFATDLPVEDLAPFLSVTALSPVPKNVEIMMLLKYMVT